jgi:predicted  nucleic acid-binding Zn-ribbon protein
MQVFRIEYKNGEVYEECTSCCGACLKGFEFGVGCKSCGDTNFEFVEVGTQEFEDAKKTITNEVKTKLHILLNRTVKYDSWVEWHEEWLNNKDNHA